MNNSKQRGVEIMDAIRCVLFEDWDPIGVNDDGPRDEYDAYIAGVYRMLCNGASEDLIVAHLRDLEATPMGLSRRSPDVLRPVARRLLGIKVALTPGGDGCPTPN